MPREALLKKLKMYRLRAKVEIEARDQLGVYVDLGAIPTTGAASYADRAVTFADPRLAGTGRAQHRRACRDAGQSAGPARLSRSTGWRWACRKAAISASRKSSPWMPDWTN